MGSVVRLTREDRELVIQSPRGVDRVPWPEELLRVEADLVGGRTGRWLSEIEQPDDEPPDPASVARSDFAVRIRTFGRELFDELGQAVLDMPETTDRCSCIPTVTPVRCRSSRWSTPTPDFTTHSTSTASPLCERQPH